VVVGKAAAVIHQFGFGTFNVAVSGGGRLWQWRADRGENASVVAAAVVRCLTSGTGPKEIE